MSNADERSRTSRAHSICARLRSSFGLLSVPSPNQMVVKKANCILIPCVNYVFIQASYTQILFSRNISK